MNVCSFVPITSAILVAYLVYCLCLEGTIVQKTLPHKEVAPTASKGRTHQDFIPYNYNISHLPHVGQNCTGPVNKTEIIHFLNEAPWNDIAWKGVDGKGLRKCGGVKCFYHSLSDPTKGYIMNIAEEMNPMVQAAKVADQLYTRVGKSVLAIPGEMPRLMDLSTSATCVLLNDLCSKKKRRLCRGILEDQQVIVHRVVRAPDPHIIYGVAGNWNITEEKWVKFLRVNNANASAVYQQLTVEYEKMNRVLEEFSDLVCDWQVMIDVHGAFYHMDLDRMTESRCARKDFYQKHYEKRVPVFLEMAKQVALNFENHMYNN